MTKKLWKITRKLLNTLADSIELVINDLVSGKRSRTRRYTRRQPAPKVIIVKIPKEQ